MHTNLKQLSKEDITVFIERLGQKPFRARQIINWIYKKYAGSFDEMTDLPKNFREELKRAARISNLNLLQRQVSKDGTQKFLFELEDRETIESVLIPNTRGKEHYTLCISSQVGCALGCTFCMTGRLGLKRNLKNCEIVDQVISVNRFIAQKPVFNAQSPRPAFSKGNNPSLPPFSKGGQGGITNIVFMGMGEPLKNVNEVVSALTKMIYLMGFSKRRITVSTAGVIPGIYKLADSGLDVNLAISLNATTDKIRNQIMPVNKKYPLKKLVDACRDYPLPPRRSITFEYVLLDGINNSGEDAQRLVRLLRGIKSKVNLIPYNPIANHKSLYQFKTPSENRTLEFQKILKHAGLTAIIRKSKGADISAACGQLKAAYK